MVKKFFFREKGFSQITFELRKIVAWFWQHRVPFGETRRNICMLTLKGQNQNLTSGQGHIVRSSRSCCIWVDAFLQEKYIETIPSALCLFYQKLEGKNECDLIWPWLWSFPLTALKSDFSPFMRSNTPFVFPFNAHCARNGKTLGNFRRTFREVRQNWKRAKAKNAFFTINMVRLT